MVHGVWFIPTGLSICDLAGVMYDLAVCAKQALGKGRKRCSRSVLKAIRWVSKNAQVEALTPLASTSIMVSYLRGDGAPRDNNTMLCRCLF